MKQELIVQNTAPKDLFGVSPVQEVLPHVAVHRHRCHYNQGHWLKRDNPHIVVVQSLFQLAPCCHTV
jgi:hypothetical protein